MLSNLSIKSHRLHPSLKRANKDIPCRVLISVQDQSALHATVSAHPQFLADIKRRLANSLSGFFSRSS
jgi:hypothetical protein